MMQTFQFNRAKVLGGLLLLFIALTGCEKDNPPAPVPQVLTVQFSHTGVAFADIDSIVVVVRDQQQFIKEWKTMQRGASSFQFDLEGFVPGSYTAEIFAYSKQAVDLSAKQYALTKSLVLPLKQPALVSAPKGNFSDSWFQRAIFSGAQDNVLIIVAMDPRDSYYELRLKSAKAKRIHLERYTVNANAFVAGKTISRNIEGLIGIGEYSDFIPFVQAMNGKSWTKGVITGWVDQEGLGDVGFAYEYFNN